MSATQVVDKHVVDKCKDLGIFCGWMVFDGLSPAILFSSKLGSSQEVVSVPRVKRAAQARCCCPCTFLRANSIQACLVEWERVCSSSWPVDPRPRTFWTCPAADLQTLLQEWKVPKHCLNWLLNVVSAVISWSHLQQGEMAIFLL